MKSEDIYFIFYYLPEKYCIGVQAGEWTFLYTRNMEEEIILKKDNFLFCLFGKTLDFFEGYEGLSKVIDTEPIVYPSIYPLFFHPETLSFSSSDTNNGENLSTEQIISQIDTFFSSHMNIQEVKIRIFEMQLGYIPSFQYKIERYYDSYFEQIHQVYRISEVVLSSSERKKLYESLFQKDILPFCEGFGFKRLTPKGHALGRTIQDDIQQVLHFEYISFGRGGYSCSISFFHPDLGSFQEGMDVASVARFFPYSSNIHMKSDTEKSFLLDIHLWKKNMQLYMIPFLDACTSKEAIKKNYLQKQEYDSIYNSLGKDTLDPNPAYYLDFSHAGKNWCERL